jgi:hypothetical protein
MKRLKKLFFPVVCLVIYLGFTGCNNENAFDCVKSTGTRVVQERKVVPFNYILVQDNIDINLIHQSGQTATIEAGKNVINNINLRNTGDTLLITNSNTCNWVRNAQPVTVSLHIQQENLTIIHRGYGEITSHGLLPIPGLNIYSLDAGGNIQLQVLSDALTVYSNSHALITVTGQAYNTYMWMNQGIGKICAEDLQVKNCNVINGGSNEIRVYPVDLLDVEIVENGNVAYYHEPARIKSKIKGSGKLIRK